MKIRLLTITHKVSSWIKQGYEEYAKRLPASCKLELIEIPAEKRYVENQTERILQKEGEKILTLIKPHHLVIALEVKGEHWSTEELAYQLKSWQQHQKVVDLLVGGPEGLAKSCLDRAQQKWSLSALTFPHALVRILVAEQIYRAYSLLNQHPYHRD